MNLLDSRNKLPSIKGSFSRCSLGPVEIITWVKLFSRCNLGPVEIITCVKLLIYVMILTVRCTLWGYNDQAKNVCRVHSMQSKSKVMRLRWPNKKCLSLFSMPLPVSPRCSFNCIYRAFVVVRSLWNVVEYNWDILKIFVDVVYCKVK